LEELKKRYPELEWKKIAGLRDKLIHHYFGIDWEIVRNVIKTRLPVLEAWIANLIDNDFRVWSGLL